jgi:[acyl-carrier-protein] S-malonyltransferase
VVHEVCNEAAQGQVCQAANINSPDQIVISGSKAAVERAAQLAKQKGAKRAVILPVSAPFHCALMKLAQDRLEQDLRALTFHAMEHKLITNVDAEIIDSPDLARDALIRQVTGAVQWEASMRKLIGAGVTTFIEVGPGKVLCGLMRQIDRSQTCLNVENEDSLAKTMNHFAPSSTAVL